jgi:hypothetical protein
MCGPRMTVLLIGGVHRQERPHKNLEAGYPLFVISNPPGILTSHSGRIREAIGAGRGPALDASCSLMP